MLRRVDFSRGSGVKDFQGCMVFINCEGRTYGGNRRTLGTLSQLCNVVLLRDGVAYFVPDLVLDFVADLRKHGFLLRLLLGGIHIYRLPFLLESLCSVSDTHVVSGGGTTPDGLTLYDLLNLLLLLLLAPVGQQRMVFVFIPKIPFRP